MQQQSKEIAAMWQAIDALDFDRIKAKLLHRHHGAMTAESIARAETGYRQFLKLAAKYPDVPVVPSEEVDEFWHMHILDTQRYSADCERIFGQMIHHDPYLGIDGPEHDEHRLDLADASRELMAREFGGAGQTQKQASSDAYCVRQGADAASVAYCVRALEETASTAYCVRQPAKEASAAYCVRSMQGAQSDAYCVRQPEKEASAAYCVRSMQGSQSDAYCVRQPAKEASAAYCVRSMQGAQSDAYCVRQPAKEASAAYCVRPMQGAQSAAYCVRQPAKEASAAYCVRSMQGSQSDAYCVRQPAKEASAAYCVRPAAKVADSPAYCVFALAGADTQRSASQAH